MVYKVQSERKCLYSLFFLRVLWLLNIHLITQRELSTSVHPAVPRYSLQPFPPLIYIYQLRFKRTLYWQPNTFQIQTSALVFPYFCSHKIRALKHQDECRMTVECMFSTRELCCKSDKSPTRGLPAPSHFALQRWHVLFSPFFFLFSSLYTPNCAESFDGGWEKSECRVEEKRN